MRYLSTTSALALMAASVASAPVLAQDEAEANSGRGLEQIIITTQRRETGLQDTAIAVAAVTGEQLHESNIVSYEDLAASVPSLSFTALSIFDHEYNIRGVTNTRLDHPTADQSIGIFIDDVYVGRSGLLNTNFYDVNRVEVVRGPQGVILGRNVVGGAISVITNAPEDTFGAGFRIGYGNFNAITSEGYVTGPLSDAWSGRLSYRFEDRDGYNEDISNNRDLDDIQSLQARGQLLFAPVGSDTNVRFIAEFTDDELNGVHSAAIPGGAGPWSASRAALGITDIRQSLPGQPTFRGDAAPTPQRGERTAWGVTLDAEFAVGSNMLFNSITGYRAGEGSNYYSQTGFDPLYLLNNPASGVSPLAFDSFVYEDEEITQFSQEFRLLSNYADSPIDWIIGGYYQVDNVDKFDRFWAANAAGIPVLSGESHWDNSGESETYAVFAQLGWRLNEQLRFVGGVRWTHDEKSGTVTGSAIENGDAYNPGDMVALTPLAGTYAEGTGYTASYSDSWEEVTPQFTIEFTPNEDILIYGTWSTGYKGGGYEDTPANPAAAMFSYDPETVTNYEIGTKIDFLDGRARLNVAAFRMDYQNLQVTQTDAGCLCNITDNAADAVINGIEIEFLFQATDNLLLWASGSSLGTEYLEFIDSNGLDNSGNFLQRTPDYQYNVGAELRLDLASWEDALRLRVNYSHQGELFWLPNNANTEDAYGLLDARATLSPADQNWTLSVWGRNLTDELYRVNVIPFFGDEMSRFGAPRTYGVEFGVEF